MARALAWSPEAIEDIESIAAYIEHDPEWYAKAVAAVIHGSRLLQPFVQRIESV